MRTHNTVFQILGRNSVHPFPARMAPDLAVEVFSQTNNRMVILDPMAGSGTALVIGQHMGHSVIGVDIDPLAVLISKVWTTPIGPAELERSAREVMDFARGVMKIKPRRWAYPRNADRETRQFVRYWFDSNSRKQLSALAIGISNVGNEIVRNALWCAFSRLIISKQSGASLAMDLPHSRPHRVFGKAPASPFRNFFRAVDIVTKNCINSAANVPNADVCIEEGDARRLTLGDRSVDLVLTSPPYLNAIDYMRCSKFTLVWMGYSIGELRARRSRMVGAEAVEDWYKNPEIMDLVYELNLDPKPPRLQERLLARYIGDMYQVICEVRRVLKSEGKLILVVGENVVRGTYVPNAALIERIANSCGLVCTNRKLRQLPANRRYLPPPDQTSRGNALNNRINNEVVLTLELSTQS